MTALPPPDIAPAEYFERWLPAQFALRYAARVRPVEDLLLRVLLEGEGGGSWDLEVRGGRLAIARAGVGTPSVTLGLSVADWRAMVVGEEGAPRLLPESVSVFDLLFIEPRSRELSRAVRGAVRFEVRDYHGRNWRLTTGFGDSPHLASPEATVAVDAETYRQLWARELPPPEAYLAGRICLEGDVGLGMALGLAMLPRFDEL